MLWPVPDSKGTPNESAFETRGIFGQHVYVNPRANAVIVVWGALPKPKGMAPIKDDDFFAGVVEALKR
ncbi:hypothetical protein [Stutzerimonas stutzeri]|uniref:hypothetical protein n=1 Tax=Stutzerimonas stutzeri TaxID=316 RepID=UPI00210A7AAD|nr:hypothetical protein [Stutzerimonas stutzeri]MCQ4318789.1 hypothetical protein [Stutzerimonas stutzeri]